MIPSPWPSSEQIARAVRQAERVVVITDYDGTLSPIASAPDMARTDTAALEALSRLSRAPGVVVAVVSGRSAQAIAERVPFAHYVAGLNGSQMRGLDLAPMDLRPARLDVRNLRARTEALSRLEGVLLEDKGAALALHTRLSPPEVAREAQEQFEAAALGLSALTLVRGKSVVEAHPRGADKGTAATAIVAAAGGGLPVYLGDDTTDEDAFRALPAPALTALVAGAPRPTAARWWLASVAEVARFLNFIASARGG